jgi:hypothetical protein
MPCSVAKSLPFSPSKSLKGNSNERKDMTHIQTDMSQRTATVLADKVFSTG